MCRCSTGSGSTSGNRRGLWKNAALCVCSFAATSTRGFPRGNTPYAARSSPERGEGSIYPRKPLAHGRGSDQGRDAKIRGATVRERTPPLSGVAQSVGKRPQNELHVFGGGTVAHGADAEALAGQRSETAGDLHAVFLEQKLANLGVVHARGNARRIERPKTVTGGNMHAQAHRLDTRDESLVVGAVALPTRMQTFLGDHGEPFAQGVEHGDRKSILILVL